MRCPSCGIDNPETRSSCANCGAVFLKDNESLRLGPYRMDSKLGEGGMGIVYHAMDEKLNREVAIKVLHPHLLRHNDLKERFRREARMHAKIIHPNIVTLLSLYEDGEHMALIMEMVRGRNLKQYMREKGGLELKDIIRISSDILSGLDAAHKQGMVHRDLKPANVLLSVEGAVKLMDFGLAKPEQGEEDLTQSGATVGSFRYMAPEQILNQDVDARTDLYAFGILLYQMCTGKLPFDVSSSGGGEFEIMEKQIREPPLPPLDLNPALPTAMSELILTLLAKTPADRPMNCDVVKQALLRISMHAEGSKKAAIRIPDPGEKPDNLQIAKGLIRALVLRTRRLLINAWKKVSNSSQEATAGGFSAVAKRISEQAKKGFEKLRLGLKQLLEQLRIKVGTAWEQLPKAWHAPVVWAGVLIVLATVGWVLISLLNYAEEQGTQRAGSAADTTVVEEKKPIEKAAAKEEKPSTPAPKKPSSRSLTFSAEYQVKRSDKSSVDASGSHEFKGGSYEFFSDLSRWNRSKKTGWTQLDLNRPTKLSMIRLYKASVGDNSFKGGMIQLEVQDGGGRWHNLMLRRDDDVDVRLTFRRPAKALRSVIAVRLSFTTTSPITIGPIELIQ